MNTNESLFTPGVGLIGTIRIYTTVKLRIERQRNIFHQVHRRGKSALSYLFMPLAPDPVASHDIHVHSIFNNEQENEATRQLTITKSIRVKGEANHRKPCTNETTSLLCIFIARAFTEDMAAIKKITDHFPRGGFRGRIAPAVATTALSLNRC